MQGVNAALEDCTVLAAALQHQKRSGLQGHKPEEAPIDLDIALQSFEAMRHRDVAALTTMDRDVTLSCHPSSRDSEHQCHRQT